MSKCTTATATTATRTTTTALESPSNRTSTVQENKIDDTGQDKGTIHKKPKTFNITKAKSFNFKGSAIPLVSSTELLKEKTFRRASTVHCIEGLKCPITKQLSGSEGALNDIGIDEIDPDVTALGVRAWIQNWSFFLALPRLMMLSQLQNLIGMRGNRTPSILPNDYMDNLLTNVKLTMKERGLNHVNLPDQEVGVALYNGQLSGLTNLQRHGDAKLEAESDHFLLTFAIAATNIKAVYGWKKQRLKGKVSASVSQVTMQLKIKQMIPNSVPPELIDFQVDEIDGINVSMEGLGPFNWCARRVLRSLLHRHLRNFLEREGKQVIEQELHNMTINDLVDVSFPLFLPLGL